MSRKEEEEEEEAEEEGMEIVTSGRLLSPWKSDLCLFPLSLWRKRKRRKQKSQKKWRHESTPQDVGNSHHGRRTGADDSPKMT